MSPPHLTADAPIADVLQPLCVNLFPVPWKETDEMITNDCQRFLCFRVPQEPLLTESRFDWHVAAIAEPDVVLILLCLRQKSPRLQQLRSFLPCFEPLESMELWNRSAI